MARWMRHVSAIYHKHSLILKLLSTTKVGLSALDRFLYSSCHIFSYLRSFFRSFFLFGYFFHSFYVILIILIVIHMCWAIMNDMSNHGSFFFNGGSFCLLHVPSSPVTTCLPPPLLLSEPLRERCPRGTVCV